MKLVVVAPNWLGDAVMALPAVADLRRHFADARIVVAARRAVAPLFAMVEGIDAVLTLPGRGGIRAIGTWRQDVRAMADGGFDTAILFPNSFAAALVARRARIPERWGFAADGRSRLLTHAVPKPGAGMHQAAYYQALVRDLGVAPGPLYARVRVVDSGMQSGAGSPYVVFAPGAAYGRAKQWPPERFAELAAIVMREQGCRIVLVGSAADKSVCATIAASVPPPTEGTASRLVDRSGGTTLAELASVLAGAEAVVSNDSGAMHMAGAVGAHVIAVFGATNEQRTAPLTNGPDARPPAILTHAAWCRPCMLRECPIDHRCMTGITARVVADAIGR